MCTQDKADKEWNDFFKKSLEKPDLPFDPRAWQAMEKKLNKRQAWRNAYRGGFFGLLVLILISTGVWYGSKETRGGHREDIRKEAIPGGQTSQATLESHRKEAINKRDNQAVASAPTTVPASAIAEEIKINPLSVEEEPNPHPASSSFQKKSASLGKNPLPAEKLNQAGLRKNAVHKKARQWAKARPFPRTGGLKSQVVADTLRSKNENPAFGESFSGTTRRDNTGERRIEQAETDKSDRISQRKKLLAPDRGETTTDGVDPLSGPMIPERANESSAPEALGIRPLQLVLTSHETEMTEWPARHAEVKVADRRFPDSSLAKRRSTLLNRWSANLMLAPDLSAVGFAHFTTPGISQGLGLEYQLSPRLSVQTGVLYASKIYSAGPDDYTPAKPWTYRKPAQVEGDCKVLDLPINLRYKFFLKERYALYVITGLSSYLMRREQYQYLYPGYPTINWTAPTKNFHWFGVVNLSLGYERKLSQRFSLQVEPYLKVPLAGVGAGKVKLITTGTFFVLKYQLGK